MMRDDDPEYDATAERERLSVTQIYWKPAPPTELPSVVVDSQLVAPPPPVRVAPLPPVPTVRVAPLPPPVPPAGWVVAPPPPLAAIAAHDRTHVVRQLPRTMVRVGFGGICVLVGIAIGSVIVFGNRAGSKATAAAAVAPAPVPVKAAPPAPAPVIAPAPARVAVHVDSEPSGATATLVDDGKTIALGATPVETQLDPAKRYEIVLALDGHQTHVQPLDPSREQHLVVVLAADPRSRSR